MNSVQEPLTSFGYWVQRRRKALDLTQESLAQQVGCSKALIKKIEIDERRPSQQIARLLAGALQLPSTEIARFVLVARGEQSCAVLGSPVSLVGFPTNSQGQTETATVSHASFSASNGNQSAQILPPPFQAPALPNHFVGRSTELTLLRDQLLHPQGQARVALVGMGGIGKSTLAANLAHQLRPHFANGVLWMNVHRSQPLDILQSWAQSFGYDFSSITDLEGRAAAVRGILADKRVLIVLDNLISAAEVRPLLPGGAGCAILITRRMQDEAAALGAALCTLDGLAEQEGLQLLAAIVGGDVVREQAPAANDICDQLQNYPLALEIVAKLLVRAGAPGGSLIDMARRLRDEKRRLNHLKLGDLSVRAAFELSWQLLNPEQRHYFAQTGVFGGRSFTLAALAHVSERAAIDSEDCLLELVGLSLVTPSEAGRYHQHPLLADFARERLTDQATSLARFSDYYLRFAQHHPSDYALLEPEWDHLMAGMQAAYESQCWEKTIAYAEALTEPWSIRARFTQARQGFEWAVEAARIIKDDNILARVLVSWGFAASEQNDYAEAGTYLTEGLELARTAGQKAVAADALYHLSRLALERNEYEEMDELLTDCEGLRLDLKDEVGVASVIYMRAFLLFRSGEYSACRKCCLQAHAIFEAHRNYQGILKTVRLLCDVCFHTEEFQQAEKYGLYSVELAKQNGLQVELAESYCSLATTYRYLNQFEPARSYAEQSQALFQKLGLRLWEAVSKIQISRAYELVEDYELALCIGMQGLSLLNELGDDYNRTTWLYSLGDMYVKNGQIESARQKWENGRTIALAIRHPMLQKFDQSLATLT